MIRISRKAAALVAGFTATVIVLLAIHAQLTRTPKEEVERVSKRILQELGGFSLEVYVTANRGFTNASLAVHSKGCSISFVGLGSGVNFLNYLSNYSHSCDRDSCSFTFYFSKPQAWEGKAVVVAWELAEEMIRIDFEVLITFQRENYVWSYPIFAFEGCSLDVVEETITKPKRPILISLNDGTNLFFLDLNGKESIFEGSNYDLLVTGSGLGFQSSSIKVAAGRTYTCHFRLYVWRGEKRRIFEAFRDVGTLCHCQVNREDNLRKAKLVVVSLLYPKSEKDVFLLGYYEGFRKMFKAYVGDVRLRIEEAELITQANILLGTSYYYVATGDPDALLLIQLILNGTKNFSVFFSDYAGVYSNNFLVAGRMDSWYQVTNPVMLIESHFLLPNIVPLDTTKLVRHAEFLMRLARKVDYAFPVFVWPDLRVEHVGAESDAALGYSYFMVLMYKLTRNETFLREAVTSLEEYMSSWYGRLYESHLVTMGIAASAELYRLTHEERFLNYIEKLSWLALRWMHLFRGDIIEEHVPFTLVAAMPQIYAAAFEYGLFKYFLERAVNILREAGVRCDVLEDLYAFYASCSAVTAKYAFPQLLNVTERLNARGGVIDPAYWVPIEDVYPVKIYGWGTLPQEIYGAGSQIIALIPPPC
ncbi:MAG: hypothetical protein QW189_05935 [Thermofilaceae archaeon]